MAYLINVAMCLIFLSTNVYARETLQLQNQDYMKYSKSVMAGAKMGLEECDRLFKHEPWNCFVSKNIKIMPIVNRARLPLGKHAA
ncbi:protein Wnt-8b-like [Paramuricea clavata]|nr:protein Wnt-8b-like [Paramuricea clavata]